VKRAALIIVNPGDEDDEEYCEGVYQDAEAFDSFLRSPIGGTWANIEILEKPRKAAVLSAVRALTTLDYSLVVFSGHGGQISDSTHLALGEALISSSDLLTGKKQTLILDCCRKPIPILLLEDLAKSIAKGGTGKDADRCRYYYDQRIEACGKDLVKLFACREGEEAADTSGGGLYSRYLIGAASDWAKNKDPNSPEYISVVTAHNAAAERVRRERPVQNPDIEKGRSAPYFPFCIVA
jgi:hypothetical protein